jgi:peptidoglycan/xylan/chitin deacetylase (PgdA/CDA1 family)
VVLFINPLQMQEDNFNKKVKYLNCTDLRKGLQQGLYDIQSHGYSHSDLTKMNEEELKFELIESQKILQQCTENLGGNQSVARHFAYPYNRANERVLKYMPEYYLSGYGANSYFKQAWGSRSAFRIPRILISYKDSPDKLILLARIHQKFI